MFLWTYFHEQAYRVDLTPSTGKWGRPYSKHRQGLGDIEDKPCRERMPNVSAMNCGFDA